MAQHGYENDNDNRDEDALSITTVGDQNDDDDDDDADTYVDNDCDVTDSLKIISSPRPTDCNITREVAIQDAKMAFEHELKRCDQVYADKVTQCTKDTYNRLHTYHRTFYQPFWITYEFAGHLVHKMRRVSTSSMRIDAESFVTLFFKRDLTCAEMALSVADTQHRMAKNIYDTTVNTYIDDYMRRIAEQQKILMENRQMCTNRLLTSIIMIGHLL